jgi:very-short-patch-repair endonuclease
LPFAAIPNFLSKSCTRLEFLAQVRELRPHSIQLFAGVDASSLMELTAASPEILDTRPVVLLDLCGLAQPEMVIDRAIDQLASVAAGLWPLWWGGEDFSELHDDALSLVYLSVRLGLLSSSIAGVATTWAESAIRNIRRGLRPRVSGAGRETEWSQLSLAVNPKGLIAVVPLEDIASHRAGPLVHALEWLAANANVAIAALCRKLPAPEPPLDRLLFGALVVSAGADELVRIDDAHLEFGLFARPESKSSVALVLPAVYGRPHPQSPVEQRLCKMIQADAELAPKFIFNARVENTALSSPKVDLLWAQGRIVIEFDGPEHRGRRAYREDRHRDYELVCAGYLVVRIPNEEIVEDFAKTLEKIRSVVRLRSSFTGDTR